MADGTRAETITLEPVLEVLGALGLAAPIEGGWALVCDVLAIPGAVERIVEALSIDTPTATPDVGDEDAPELEERWVDYVVPCGIAVRIDGVVRAWPGCCADWGALRDLAAAVDVPAAEREAWLGHDGGAVSVRALDALHVALSTRRDGAAPTESWVVARARLARAIEDAWNVIDRFEAAARPLIDARLGAPRTVRSRDRM